MRPLFELILRTPYQKLPEVVQRFHAVRLGQFEGRAEVRGATGFMAKLLRRLGGFPPPASDAALTVRVLRTEVQERWHRQFNSHQFSSTLSRINRENLLCENFGLLSFFFALRADGERIHWQLHRWSLAGIPMPDLLGPDITAWEGVDAAGNYCFAVTVEFPLVGMLMDYSGFLVIPLRTEAAQ